MSENTKKKRGRKPKNKIIPPKSIDTQDKNDGNKIICIRVKDEKNIQEEILPGYIAENFEISKKQDLYCWNCCSKLDKSYKSIPIKYSNTIFYIHGYFCNESCSLRYLYDNYQGRELWTKYELFNFYCSKLYGKTINVNVAPNRLSLQIFGGNLTTEEYRSNSINYIEINTPPIIPINNQNIKYETTKLKENKEGLKLYRKKTKKNNDGILDNMQTN